MSTLLDALVAMASATDVEEYLHAQGLALSLADDSFLELSSMALESPSDEIKFEGLSVLSLLESSEAETVIRKSFETDSDGRIAEFAKAMLFRLATFKTVRDGGHMPREEYVAYRDSVRRMSAQALFGASP